MILISFFFLIILFLGDSVLLGGFKLGAEFFNFSVVNAKFAGCRFDGDFILDDIH